MFNRKTITVATTLVLFVAGACFADDIEDNWNDFLHYIKIGRLDLAKDYGQVVLDSNPDPVTLLGFVEDNPQGYALLLKVSETPYDPNLAELSGKILDVIEQGRFIRRADPEIIAEEIRRLSSTARGQLAAVKRLKNAGEYAIAYMLDAMADRSRKEELPNIVWALPQIGKDAIRPLAAALQTENTAIRAEIIKALGQIGYPQSLSELKYVVENDSSAELRSLAAESVRQIEPAALAIPSAQLFYRLAENYYYHAGSLVPVEDMDFANIWFWDSSGRRLIMEKVDRKYFYELMSMRSCEFALKADADFGKAIGLWLAAYLKAESAGVDMPNYFGSGHASASVYAVTAGPEYLHQALARAIKDGNAHVALAVVEALATTAGEKSLFYRLGMEQPLLAALSFDDKAVRYSAAIAIAAAGPQEYFAESRLVVENLAQAIGESAEQTSENTDAWNGQLAESYAFRSAVVMLKLAQTRNPVIKLSDAQDALIKATKDERTRIQTIAAEILARINSSDAQGAVATMALSEKNPVEVRISGFNSLAISAKINANLLDDEKIDAIYSLVSSKEINPQLRSAAASAYGALNLPSEKVKNLILDQARS